MFARSIPRFLLQAGLLIAAAVIVALVHVSAPMIVAVMAAAFALVVAGEWLATREVTERAKPVPAAEAASEPRPLARRRPARTATTTTAPLLRPPGRHPQPGQRRAEPPPASPPPVTPKPAAPPPAARSATQAPTPPPAARPTTANLPTAPTPAQPALAPRKTPVPPPPGVADEPEIRPVPLPPRAPAPAPPAPQPAAAPPPPPAPPIAPPIAEHRVWNVFDLQNRARKLAGPDPARDEELSFLLLYLREFADVAGDLPEDFDPFVRESFPDLIAS